VTKVLHDNHATKALRRGQVFRSGVKRCALQGKLDENVNQGGP
jgi:hypothetical protein